MKLNEVASTPRTSRLARAARRPLVAAVAMALLLGLDASAAPAGANWTGAVSSDWTAAGNWTSPPDSGSSVLINTTVPNRSVLDGASADVFLLTVGSSNRGTLDIVHGGKLTVSGNDGYGYGAIFGQQLTPVGSWGEVTVSGAGSELTVDAGAQIGNDGTGILTVRDGGTANLGLGQAYTETLLGFGNYGWAAQGNAGNGTLNVDGAGSTVNYAGGLNVLNGEVNVSGGGQLLSHARAGDGSAFWVDAIGFGVPANPDGSYAGLDGVGKVTVSGAGSAWISGNGLQVGFGGTGDLSILDGGKASFAGFATLGNLSYLYDSLGGSPVAGLAGQSGTGRVVVSGAGSALTMTVVPDVSWGSGYITLGYDGPGSLTVNEGGTVTAPGGIRVGPEGSLVVGGQDGAGALLAPGTVDTPTVALQGSSATLQLRHTADDYTLAAAISGDGRVQASGGVTRLSGDSSDFTGIVGIDGGATLEVTGKLAGQLHAGIAGAGTLRIVDGGAMHALGGAALAESVGSHGEVIVSGAGSILDVDADMLIGRYGDGSLTVSNGGTANLGLATQFAEPMIGSVDFGQGFGVSAGRGEVTVDGAGSVLNYGGGFNVVNGSVAVTDGGQLVRQVRAADGDAFWVDVIGLGAPGQYGGPAWRGSGAVTVSGAGSAWDSQSQLQMGYGGDASLSILDGGEASFAGSAEVGSVYYLRDPATGIATASQQGSASVRVSGAGSALTVVAVPDTTWGTGTIGVGRDGAGSLTVDDGGKVAAAGGIRLGAMGTLTVGRLESDGAATAPGSLDVAAIDFAAPSATLTFRHTGELYLFDAPMSGNGHIDAIGGFTRLTGDSSAFIGTTLVDGGATLSVNGYLGGDILVGAQGTLEGIGTVGNLTVGGTLAPGNSPGTLHVAGDLLMQTGSVYAAQIDPGAGVSDSVEVAGSVTIEPGTTLTIESLGTQPLAPGANIELIRTTGEDSTVSGQFDNTEGTIGSFLGYGVTYEDGKINVGLTRSQTSFASVGYSAGTRALGAALDGLADSSPLTLLLFSQVTTPEQAAAAFGAMAGNMNADLRRMLVDDSRTARDAIGRHLQQAGTEQRGTAWWVEGLGHWGSQDGAGDVPRARANGSGLLMGVDTGVGDATRIGLAAGAGQTSYDMAGQDAHVTDRHLAFYGHSGLDAFGVSYGLASTWHDIRARRHFGIGSALQSTDSSHDARTDQAFVDAGYRIAGSKGYIEPFASVAHVVLHNDTATEKGSVAALVTRGGNDAATFGTLGARWAVQGNSAQWYGSLGWRHAFGFGRTVATQSFVAGGAAFETAGLPLARNAAALELGARFDVSKRVHVAAGYTGQWSSSASDQGAQMTLAVDL